MAKSVKTETIFRKKPLIALILSAISFNAMAAIHQGDLTTDPGTLTEDLTITGSIAPERLQNLTISNPDHIITVQQGIYFKPAISIDIDAKELVFAPITKADYMFSFTGSGKLDFHLTGDLIAKNANYDALVANGGSKYNKNWRIDGNLNFDNVTSENQFFLSSGQNITAKNITILNSAVTGDYGYNATFMVLNGSLRAKDANGVTGDIVIDNFKFTNGQKETGGLLGAIYTEQATVEAKNITISNLEAPKARDSADMFGLYLGVTSQVTIDDSLTISGVKGDKAMTRGIMTESGARYEESALTASTINVNNISAVNIATGIENISEDKKSAISAGTIDVNTISANEATGVYLSGATSHLNATDSLTIHTVTGSSVARGLVLESGSNLVTPKVNVSNVKSDQGIAAGVWVDKQTATMQTLAVSDVQGKNLSAGIMAVNGSNLTLETATVFGSPTTRQSSTEPFYALYSNDSTLKINNVEFLDGSVVADNNALIDLSGKNSHLKSQMYASNGGALNLKLDAGSQFEGTVDDYWDMTSSRTSFKDTLGQNDVEVKSSGSASLTMAGGTWKVTDRSFVSNLAFTDGLVDMTGNKNKALAIKKLDGNAKFAMKLGKSQKNDQGQIDSDMLYIADMADTSKHTIDVIAGAGITSIEDMEGLRFATTNKTSGVGNFTLSFKDQGILNRTFQVKTEAYDVNDADNVVYNGDGKDSSKLGNAAVDNIFGKDGQNWYIETGDIVNPEPSPDPKPEEKPDGEVSQAGQALFATGKAAYWTAVEMDRFTNRMGDMRYANGDDGLWIRARHGRIGTDSGEADFRSNSTTYQVGYDHAFKTNEGRQIVGIAFDYTDTELDYKGIKGEGQTDRYALTAYNSYLGDNGVYYDAVAKYAQLKNDFDIINGSGGRVSADYDNEVYGISFEAGAKLSDARTGMFIEPNAQLQYTYVNEAHYHTSQNSSVDQGNIESLIARMGYRIGRQFGETQQHVLYAKADYFHEFMGNQKYTIRDVTTTRNGASFEFENKGDWFDIGAGGQTSFAKNAYAFVDAEMRFGNDFENTWIFNAGMRWQF